MSDVSVDIIKNRSGEAPDLPSGANLSGVSTAATLQVTNLNPTHINASGVTTATTFSGSMKSTGTPTLGLGVTINSSGINISGVATAGIISATTLYGDGSNLTGVAMSIAPISYQPDVNDTLVTKSSVSIGMTFTQRVIAGSGNVTLRIAGAAGTVVENFGVGSSVTIANNTVSVTPTADLAKDTVYHINYPSGSFTNTGGDVSYVGTAYTFTADGTSYQFWTWGSNTYGALGQNNRTQYSSPVQVPGDTWSNKVNNAAGQQTLVIPKTDGTLWSWGYNQSGSLGQNNRTFYSSPVQVGSDATWDYGFSNSGLGGAIKTDGTLWGWGRNLAGMLGQNQPDNVRWSSPVQIMGSATTWSSAEGKVSVNDQAALFIKTDGTIWGTGAGGAGRLCQPTNVYFSSPVQVSASTNWSIVENGYGTVAATKTDGTLWNWGENENGMLGQNSPENSDRSSPVQIGSATNWTSVSLSYLHVMAVNTSGELWTWGKNSTWGNLGVNNRTEYSSPVQVPGTNWSTIVSGTNWSVASKTDGTAWAWGQNDQGQLGLNDTINYSSPTQIPGTTWNYKFGSAGWRQPFIIKEA